MNGVDKVQVKLDCASLKLIRESADRTWFTVIRLYVKEKEYRLLDAVSDYSEPEERGCIVCRAKVPAESVSLDSPMAVWDQHGNTKVMSLRRILHG